MPNLCKPGEGTMSRGCPVFSLNLTDSCHSGGSDRTRTAVVIPAILVI